MCATGSASAELHREFSETKALAEPVAHTDVLFQRAANGDPHEPLVRKEERRRRIQVRSLTTTMSFMVSLTVKQGMR